MSPENRREGERLHAQATGDLDATVTRVSPLLEAYVGVFGPETLMQHLQSVTHQAFAEHDAAEAIADPNERSEALDRACRSILCSGLLEVGFKTLSAMTVRDLLDGVPPR